MAYNQPSRSLTEPFPRWSVIVAVVTLLAAFAVVLSAERWSFLQSLERGYGDIRTALLSERLTEDHPRIVIVSIGDNVNATRATFDRNPVNIDRAQLARLIDVIDDSAPRAIGFDVPLAGAGDPVKDQSLQRALREAKARVVIGVRSGTMEANAERRAWLGRFIKETGRPAGHIGVIYEGNRVTGVDSGLRALEAVPDSFAMLIARTQRPEVRRNFGHLTWLQKVEPGGFLSRFLNTGAQQPFPVLYADDLIDSTRPLPTRQLAGRLVLVTTGLAEIERHATPLTAWTGEFAAPIQIQAQAIAQHLDGRSVIDLEPRTLRLLLFTLACVAGFLGWYRWRGWNIFGTLIGLIALVVVDALAFSWYGLMLPLVPALLAWLLGDTAGRSLRYILNWEERHGLHWPPPEPEAPKPAAAKAGPV